MEHEINRSSRRKSALVPRIVDNDELVKESSTDLESEKVEQRQKKLIRKKSTAQNNKNISSPKTPKSRIRQLNLKDELSNSSQEASSSVRKSNRKISPVKRFIESNVESSAKKANVIRNLNHNENLEVHTPKTPRKQKIIETNTKTPHHVRTRIKKELTKIKKDESCESDSSYSEHLSSSEEEKSSSESSNESEEKSEDEEEEEKEDNDLDEENCEKTKNKKISLNKISVSQTTRKNNLKTLHNDFVLKSDEYFSHHSTNKVFTSDRTLDSLKTPRLEHDQLFNLLKSLTISETHEKLVGEMIHEYTSYFKKWLLLLEEDFNLLLYGLGSKLNLIKTFHEEHLLKEDVLVVNGFFPGLNFKDILDNIANNIMDLNIPLSNLNTVVDCIEKECAENYCYNIFLIIHNIDGIMLRNDRSQTILSRLAKIKNIHLITSIDHINAPMLWNASILSNYNFSWWDVTTMLPYTEETAFENSLLVQNSGALVLSSMKNVFQSLTVNAKGIYLTIVKHQTENKINQHYQGMAFKELYSKCREGFLVSSDLALRAQLTEFLDHKLVKLKRANDGSEYLNIPLENKLLLQFLELEP